MATTKQRAEKVLGNPQFRETLRIRDSGNADDFMRKFALTEPRYDALGRRTTKIMRRIGMFKGQFDRAKVSGVVVPRLLSLPADMEAYKRCADCEAADAALVWICSRIWVEECYKKARGLSELCDELSVESSSSSSQHTPDSKTSGNAEAPKTSGDAEAPKSTAPPAPATALPQ